MATELAVNGSQQLACLSAQAVREQVNLIQAVMAEVMTKDEHYGVIPGCGDKPTLLKSGAEKLCLTFRLDMQPDIQIVDLGNGHREYRARIEVFHIDSGKRIGAGVGSASTLESKYRWRGGSRLCPNCNKPTIKRSKFPPKTAAAGTPPGWYCFARIGGCGAEFNHDDSAIISQSEERQENPDIADTYNTVLKMAKKRAMVDAALSTTAASDIFTQDIEDFDEHVIDSPSQLLTPERPPQQAKPKESTPQQQQKKTTKPNGMAWLDVYENEVNTAPDEESLRIAEFNARGHFDRMTAEEKASHKDRLLAIRATKETKRKTFASDLGNDSQITARRAIIDQLVAEFGQERFLLSANHFGLRGDSDRWPLEKLNAVKQSLESDPF